jgi:hypothetical protein
LLPERWKQTSDHNDYLVLLCGSKYKVSAPERGLKPKVAIKETEIRVERKWLDSGMHSAFNEEIKGSNLLENINYPLTEHCSYPHSANTKLVKDQTDIKLLCKRTKLNIIYKIQQTPSTGM